jgi:hypothetical protein
MRSVPVLYKTLREFPIGTRVELDPNGGVPEINPVTDVPRPDLSRVREGLQHRREPTDAEDAADDGKGNFAACHWLGSGKCTLARTRAICVSSSWSAAVDAIALHQEPCDRVVEQF